MRLHRFVPLFLVFSVLGCLWAQSACADEAAAIYDPSAVVFVDLTLSAEAEAKLEAEPDEYVSGTFSMTKSSDGTPAGEATPFISERPVEVRLKGSVGGSFRKLSEKPGLKLKFKKANAVLGLRKMTLNNMVQDPSMLHETLAYAAFRANGVPASRTGLAYVRLNSEDIGVYLDLENLDDIGLGRIFATPFDDETQHLYEGEQGDDVFPGGEVGFEVDEGSEEDIADLEALIEAANGEGDEPWSERLAASADLSEMTKMWAVEKYIDHWDGYSGHTDSVQAEKHERPNNYYLYSEPSGRFQMLPWGTDQAWIPTIGVETPGREVTFDGPGGILFNECLEDEACFGEYWKALRDVTEAIAALGPAALAEDTAGLLSPWQAEEIAHGHPEYDAEEIKEDKYGVDGTLAFINGRQAEAEAWLADNEPPEEEEPAGPATPGSTPSDPPLPTAQGPVVPDLVPGRFAVADGVLVSHLWVSGAGAVQQRVSISTRHGRVRACATGEPTSAAGPVILRCKLSNAVQRRLRKRSVGLRIYTTFVPTGRGGTVAMRELVAAKDPSL